MNDAVGDPQSVLLLGGTSEIGQGIVRALVARRTRRVVLAARRPDACAAFADEVRAGGANVETITFDADDLSTHGAVMSAAFASDVDVVIVAFGVLGDQAIFDRDPAAAAAVAHTNFTAAVSASLVAVDRMKTQGHGTLVVLSSVAGERVRAANFVYGSTKAGLDGFAQGLGDSLKGTGVRVMTVRPGFVRTKMTAGMKEAPFTTTVEVVAADVVRGLASGAHTVWSPGVLRYVFTGLRHLPRQLWRLMPS
jgi:decaprenylphospho-beta-D-erythro-pentofuranosid-2-ulose 2-reductase